MAIPFLAFNIIQGGVGGFIHLAGTITGASQSAASQAANESVTNNKSFDNLSDLMYKCITSELSDPGPPKELSHDLDEIPDHWTPDMYKRVVDSFSEYAKQMNDPLVTDTKIKCIINNYIKAYKNPRDVDPNAQTKLDQIKNDCVNSILSDPGPPVF